MIQTLFIPGTIPSLNKLSSASVVTTRAGKKVTKYGQSKKTWTRKVFVLAKVAKLRPVVGGAYFTFWHVLADKRTDPDNFCGVAQKVALDGLKKAGIIPNDGWADVLGLAHYWGISGVAKHRGVWIVLSHAPLDRLDAIAAMNEALERRKP